jgi:hypothetical protein
VSEDRAIELPVLPGRLQRLADELAEEAASVLEASADHVALLVELAYALRPQRFEGRTPTYGVLLPPNGSVAARLEFGQHQVELVDVDELDVQFARRFADGVTSFAVRDTDGIGRIACFTRDIADEYDLVRLQASIGGSIVQRHPDGQVRVFGPHGVVRWDGVGWHCDPPIDAWLRRLGAVAPTVDTERFRPLLRFAVHELGARRIGATLIWRPIAPELPAERHEALVHHAPRLRLDHVGEEAALAHALAQIDGAALFDGDLELVALGIRLAPSRDAARLVGAMHGMRHTAALRYSHDDRDAVVVAVSDAGPVTVMYRGEVIDGLGPADVTIG